MFQSVSTVTSRIGVDNHDSYNELCNFIHKVSSMSPARHFIIHSRKALLSPAENRRVPPLRYEYFFALLRDFPDLQLTINAGIVTINEVNSALKAGAHGVMVCRARAAYNNAIYGVPSSEIARRQFLEIYQQYAHSVMGSWGCKCNKPSFHVLAKPILGLFHSEPRCGLWKRHVDAAFSECKTMKSLLEKTLPVMPLPPSSKDPFTNIHVLLPPPYTGLAKELSGVVKDEEVQE